MAKAHGSKVDPPKIRYTIKVGGYNKESHAKTLKEAMEVFNEGLDLTYFK